MGTDWNRIFPDSDHRWVMGLRQAVSAADFFADADATGETRAARARWLQSHPERYVAVLPDAQLALGETLDWARELGFEVRQAASDLDQLIALSCEWEPDFAWMHPGADGRYRVTGGAVCFPSAWSLIEKLGQPMRIVHEPVPQLNEVLGRQIDTFLERLSPGTYWRRENWSLAADDVLNHHPEQAFQPLMADTPADSVWLRIEHQLLCKLPRCRSIFFGIRMELVPLRDILVSPDRARRFLRVLSTMSDQAARYKNIAVVRPQLTTWLQEAADRL